MEPGIPTSLTNVSNRDAGNPNLSTKQDHSHPLGTGLGAAMGGAGVGFASGWFGGPIGMAIGTIVGAVAGGLAGSSISEKMESPEGKRVETNP